MHLGLFCSLFVGAAVALPHGPSPTQHSSASTMIHPTNFYPRDMEHPMSSSTMMSMPMKRTTMPAMQVTPTSSMRAEKYMFPY